MVHAICMCDNVCKANTEELWVGIHEVKYSVCADQLPLLGKWGSMTSPGRSEVGLGCKVTEGGGKRDRGEDETAKVYDESRRPRTETRESHCATAKTLGADPHLPRVSIENTL